MSTKKIWEALSSKTRTPIHPPPEVILSTTGGAVPRRAPRPLALGFFILKPCRYKEIDWFIGPASLSTLMCRKNLLLAGLTRNR